MTDHDKKDDWEVPVIRLDPDTGGRLPWPPDPPDPKPELSHEQIEEFENRCYLCFHRSWDVFESGAPMWWTCKHRSHQSGHYGGEEYRYIECVRVAERYRGERCPKFWPVILRAPFRIAFRVGLGVLRYVLARRTR